MSEGGGTRIGIGLAAGAALLALLAFDGPSGPSNAEPPETCGMTAPWVCVDGKRHCPAVWTCPTPVAGAVDDTTPTTALDPAVITVPDTSITATETVPPRPSSEAAPLTTTTVAAAPVVEASVAETVPVEPRPACVRMGKVQAGDDSWALLAGRYDVWTRDLLRFNQATKETPLIVGMVVCLPASVYGDGSSDPTTAPTQPPATAAPTTVAPLPPETQAPTSVAPAPPVTAPPTQAPTTAPRRPPTTKAPATVPPTAAPTSPPKSGQDAPKQPQAPGTNPPGTTGVPPCQSC